VLNRVWRILRLGIRNITSFKVQSRTYLDEEDIEPFKDIYRRIKKMKKAFITGITGQDGSYLAELLLEKNYEVHAIIRRASVFTTQRIDHFSKHPNLYTYYGDLTDSSNLHRLLTKIKPDEVYNLGAQSHVAISFEVPEYTADVVGTGAIRLLDVIRDIGLNCKYYQASTSELFGGIPGTEPQSEATPFYPKSPYGAAKLYAYWVTVNYRESYNMFACNGILFNHESPRRGENFVTKKITQSVARIYQGRQQVLKLGNMNAKRDWGHAKDFVYAQWLMLQQDEPQDLVIASGETHTVREFVEVAFKEVGIKIEWQGAGINEKGVDTQTGKTLVEVDEKYFRPAEVELLWGDPSKAEKELGWERKISFQELVSGMVKYDLENEGFGGQE
jgi:GDPmannose 4,6-dehydratase